MSEATGPVPTDPTAPTPMEASMDTPTRTVPKRPPFDPAALIFGVVFVVIAVLALLDAEVARRVDLGIVWAAAFVGAGAVLLATTMLRRDDDGRRAG